MCLAMVYKKEQKPENLVFEQCAAHRLPGRTGHSDRHYGAAGGRRRQARFRRSGRQYGADYCRMRTERMKSWEVVREIENQCANNQMRDIFSTRSKRMIPWNGSARRSREAGRAARRPDRRGAYDRVRRERRRVPEIPVYGAVTHRCLRKADGMEISRFFADTGLYLPTECVTIK